MAKMLVKSVRLELSLLHIGRSSRKEEDDGRDRAHKDNEVRMEKSVMEKTEKETTRTHLKPFPSANSLIAEMNGLSCMTFPVNSSPSSIAR